MANIRPKDDTQNVDPHEDPRLTPSAQLQTSDFLQPDGTFVDTCDASPSHSSDYTTLPAPK